VKVLSHDVHETRSSLGNFSISGAHEPQATHQRLLMSLQFIYVVHDFAQFSREIPFMKAT